jgi:hypothetical protein
MSSFNRGYTFTSTDLFIKFYDALGRPIVPYSVKFSVYIIDSGAEVVVSDGIPIEHRDATQLSSGSNYFWAGFTSLPAWAAGTYRIVWETVDVSGSPTEYVNEDFLIIVYSVTVDDEESKRAMLRKKLRIMLRDNNPDRNYKFMPYNSSVMLYNMSKLSYVWEDEELDTYMDLAMGFINLTPPKQWLSITSIDSNWTSLLLMGAASFACRAKSLNWAVDGFDYSLGQVSLNLSSKASDYSGQADSYYTQFNELLVQMKGSLRYTVGILNSPYTFPLPGGPLGWRTYVGRIF